MKKILFLILPSYTGVYKDSKIAVAVPKLPLLSVGLLLKISALCNVEKNLLDLSLSSDFIKDLNEKIKQITPDYIAFGFTTALYNEAKTVSFFIKNNFPHIKILCGGVHPSIFPQEILKEFPVDIVFINESEKSLTAFLNGTDLEKINGIAFRKNREIIINHKIEYLDNLDDLPYPDWREFNLQKYYYPKINVRKPPALPLSTSRGCIFNCIFCTKSVHGYKFRTMSPERVVSEIEFIKKMGANEFHIWDDQFTTDLERAKKSAN